jgi:hypothetical protein
MMKIPNSVRIAGVEYAVRYVAELNNGVNLAYGHIDYENSVIRLSSTIGTEHQKRCQTLLHEILHGIRENNGMEIENEEAIVDMFAKGIYQVLQDNGARFFDLATDKPMSHKKCETCRHFTSCERAFGGGSDDCSLYDVTPV